MTCEHSTDHFLPWHRMFLHYFELTVQAVLSEELNDDSSEPFAVPYWDFTSDDPEKRKIPKQFREAGDDGTPNSNPLWYTDRDEAMNRVTGAEGLSDIDVDTKFATSQNRLLGGSLEGPGFQRLLDQTPHGNIHIAVGKPFLGMSVQELAARDPVFWPFHSNDDRLWESWRNPLGQSGKTVRDPAGQAWLNHRFRFAGPSSDALSEPKVTVVPVRGDGLSDVTIMRMQLLAR